MPFETLKDTNPMNHNRLLLKTLGLGSLLALSLSLTSTALRAGLPPSASQRTSPVAAIADAGAIKTSDTNTMACAACKTVAITERTLLPGTKAGTSVSVVGSRHECAMCGGEITTANGTTVDSMGRNCLVCGSSVTSCCPASAVPQKG